MSADEFITAASVPTDGSSHAGGTLDAADGMLAASPELARASIYTAAVLGDDEAVRRFIAADAAMATAKGGPRGWDALTCLCFSRYLRLDRSRSDAFVRAATALLEAGANPNTGWFDATHQPNPEWESAIYGAAGIAHDAPLTRLLLERGADPNDEETPYHAPETYDNGAVQALVESGMLNADSLATILLRKADWHDHDAVAWLLAHGGDPNRQTRFGRATVLHHAVRRDNNVATLTLLLDRGANARLPCDDGTAVAMAARRGRGDFLAELQRRNVPLDLRGADDLLAACALNDSSGARSIAASQPDALSSLVEHGGRPLAEFAGNGNTDGVRLLLDLGRPDRRALHRGGWVLGRRARQHGTPRRCVARAPRYGEAAHRARRRRQRAGRAGPLTARACREGVRGFVLERRSRPGFGRRAAGRRRGDGWDRASVRISGSG